MRRRRFVGAGRSRTVVSNKNQTKPSLQVPLSQNRCQNLKSNGKSAEIRQCVIPRHIRPLGTLRENKRIGFKPAAFDLRAAESAIGKTGRFLNQPFITLVELEVGKYHPARTQDEKRRRLSDHIDCHVIIHGRSLHPAPANRPPGSSGLAGPSPRRRHRGTCEHFWADPYCYRFRQ